MEEAYQLVLPILAYAGILRLVARNGSLLTTRIDWLGHRHEDWQQKGAAMGSKQNTQQIAALSYEEGQEQLHRILERLEATDLPLDESLELYEQGMKLAAHCGQKLEEAELRVKQWRPDPTLQECIRSQDT